MRDSKATRLAGRLRIFPTAVRNPLRATVRAGEVQQSMAALPFADLNAITGGGPILVLAPHPDDESLGCGGLIAEASARGLPPVVVVLTDGTMSHPRSAAYPAPRLKAVREAEARAAVGILGVPSERLHFLGYQDGGAPSQGTGLAEAAARVSDLAGAHGVGTILATWRHDPHRDHAAAYAIAREAARLSGARLVAYPVWGWLLPAGKRLPDEPVRGARLDVTARLPAKRRAVAAHRSQVTDLIPDDPTGFRLNDDVLAFHDRPFEVFLFADGAVPGGV